MLLFDQIARPVLGLNERAAEIFADDAQRKQLDAAEHQLGVLSERGEPGEQHRQRLLLVVTGYENRHGAFVFVRCLFPLMPDLV